VCRRQCDAPRRSAKAAAQSLLIAKQNAKKNAQRSGERAPLLASASVGRMPGAKRAANNKVAGSVAKCVRMLRAYVCDCVCVCVNLVTDRGCLVALDSTSSRSARAVRARPGDHTCGHALCVHACA
jgi:hypothetical protein